VPNNDLNSTPPIAKLSRAEKIPAIVSHEEAFAEILTLISASRERALQAVNSTLITLYWEIGAMISRKTQAADWGDGVVDELAAFIAQKEPNLRGFTRRNLFRMRQFYEAYVKDSIVSPLETSIPLAAGMAQCNSSPVDLKRSSTKP